MVEAVSGQVYPGGIRVEFPDMGLSFVVPEGWLGSIPQESTAFVMGSESQPGIIIALTHGAATTQEVVENLQEPMPLDESVMLHPQGQPVVEPPWVKVAILATDGTGYLPGYLVALVREDGPGALYIAFGQAGPQAFYRLVAGLAASTQTTAPRPAAAAPETQEPLPLLRSRGGAEIRLDRAAETPPQLGDEASPLAQQWLEHLRGKKVSFLESYSSGASGGYAMRRDFYLCSDGRFSFRENSSVSIYVPGASAGSGGRSSGEGRWRVLAQGEHAVLELAWSDGAVAVRRLEYAEGRTYIDGERWYVTEENDLCG